MQKYGFNLIKEMNLAEVGGIARLWEHEKCKAQILSICNSDENKCFGANFFTPPTDSTGVAHILEHSVLCGSDKYPVKEPFVELLKGSLQTFLNAFTFPDKTCYPVASANLKDFYNLIDVYLDAVFHPLLDRDIFSQEGWHVEAETADGPWSFKGVVYNEMKGVYSSPDSVLAESSQQSLFPDNLYSLDSGGTPNCIPNLTYEAFTDFHRRYYQPGNTRFFFWGDDPEDERLRIISKAVQGYKPLDNLPVIPLQKPFSKPVTVEKPYSATKGETRGHFTLNWLLEERGNVETALLMEMLEHILEGLPGSPLRRALMESGLGEDTTGGGLETDLRQMFYSTGLKGVQPADVIKGEELILATLRDLAEKGIDRDAINAAINSVEFAYRENNSGRLPRGLSAMIFALSTWLYGGDPFAPLAWEQPLEKIKKAVSQNEKVFENAIRKYFLENNSRTRVTLLPDEKLGEVLATEETARLAGIQEESSPARRQAYVEETSRLQEKQLAPDLPEYLARIPSLKISDLPLKNRLIPCGIEKIPQIFLFHDLPTSGIAYVSALLPVEAIPENLIPYIPLYARSLTEWGTAFKDYSALGIQIASNLGGLSVNPLIGLKAGTRTPYMYLNISAKSVYDKIPVLFDILGEIILHPQKDKSIILKRLSQMILEDKARLEYSLQAAGHMATGIRLRAHFSGEGLLAEQMGGVSQLWFLRDLANRLEKEPDKIISDFTELGEILISGKNMLFNCTCEEKAAQNIRDGAKALAASLPESPALVQGTEVKLLGKMTDLPRGEAFLTPGQVNYVGKASNLYDLGFTYNGAASVISRWLRMGYLWEEVRVAGGAYGVFCSLDRIGGVFSCLSYRDPNVDRTLSAYDGLGPYLQRFNPSPQQLEQAIIGAVGDLDTYLLPDAKGALSLAIYLSGETEEGRQKMREEMLATTASDFRNFSEIMTSWATSGDICVLGGEKTAQAAKEHSWKIWQLL